MESQTTEALVDEAQALTDEMRSMFKGVAECNMRRREVWAALNQRGISQKRIAATCGVVEHTVYTELRKRREAAE